jgi:hypothetical protein
VSGYLSVAETLDRVRAQVIERREAWNDAGNTGRPPPEPRILLVPLAPNTTRADASLWRKLAHGRARIAHDRCGQASPFCDFRDIYTLPEAELVQAVNLAEQIVRQDELAAWEVERLP